MASFGFFLTKLRRTVAIFVAILFLSGCRPLPAAAAPAAPPSAALVEPPQVPQLSPLGENLIIEFEVGGISGYNRHPELPDLRYSGVTIGVGYDLHQSSRETILADWHPLPAPAPARLAETQPFYGKSAVEPWKKVRDIVVPWETAHGVFDRIDVAREYARARRALPGFDRLRPNAQAALISLGFNRGWSFTGDNRREMRAIRDLVMAQNADYGAIASQLRQMPRVWRGTSIEKGMVRRRNAEATLILTP
jgi:hypothetical protein